MSTSQIIKNRNDVLSIKNIVFNRHFSETYEQARTKFKSSAQALGAQLSTYSVASHIDNDLTIDVAILGEENLPTLILTSGVHGVEGFFGSAVQAAFMESIEAMRQPLAFRVVMIHAVNPYGFKYFRRVNEDNIDLNRNFLEGGEYKGAPKGYDQLNEFLNPSSKPWFFDSFYFRVLWNILRYSLKTLKKSIAPGQYKYPKGLFFGGFEAAQSTKIIMKHIHSWLGTHKNVVHLDLHTGLGKTGIIKLLLTKRETIEDYHCYETAFGAENIEYSSQSETEGYRSTGLIGEWLQSHCSDKTYHFATAEIGTYNVIKVIKALQAENRAHFHAEPNSNAYLDKKQNLLERFSPDNKEWQDAAISQGLLFINKSINNLLLKKT